MTHRLRWAAVALILLALFVWNIAAGTVATAIVIVGALVKLLRG